MIDSDWLCRTSSTTDGSSSGTAEGTFTASDCSAESIPSLAPGQRLCVGLGIGSIAAYLIYAIYRGSRRGPPQILWNSPPTARRRLQQEMQQSSSHVEEADCTERPTLALVNFPKRMQGQFERSLRPLIDAAELEVQYVSVVFYHEATDMTPSNVEAVVQREVLAAFDELDGTPCAVYHSAIAIDGEPINPFWTAKEAVKASRGRVLLERHCIGYTVDGGRVEILTHDTHGKINAVDKISPVEEADERLDDVNDSLRRRFCATTRTFCRGNGDKWDFVSSSSPLEAAKIIEGPYAACFDVLWLSPVPLFAMFGAALRYARVVFDGWTRLAEPAYDSTSFVFAALQYLRLWGYRGKRQSDAAESPLKQSQWDLFTLEIELHQNLPCIPAALDHILREALGETAGKGNRGGGLNSNNERDPILLNCVSSGNGSVLRCRLRSNLTVFQALQEVWRLGALVACLNYDVLCLRLLCAVKPPPSSASATGETISVKTGAGVSWPYVPLYPLSLADVKSSYPSFFSSAQYFSLLGEGGRVEASDAFRRIQDGRVQYLHYVVAEYMTNELRS